MLESEKQRTSKEIGNFVFSTVSKGYQIQAERVAKNKAKELNASKGTPAELVKLRPAIFIREVLGLFHNHISKHWTVEMVAQIEADHREMILVYGRKPHV